MINWLMSALTRIIRLFQKIFNISSNNKLNLHDLPPEMLDIIIQYSLANKVEVNVIALISKRINAIFWPRYLSIRMLNDVANGQYKNAKSIIKIKPDLLLQRGRATHDIGATLEGTALQMALCVEDPTMVKMILKYFIKLPFSFEQIAEEIANQIDQQFPKDYKEKFHRLQQEHKEKINAIASAIIGRKERANNSSQIIDEFIRAIIPQKIIRQGVEFNFNLIINMLEEYNNYAKKFGRIKEKDQDFKIFWLKALGGAQFILPPNYAQALCQGLPEIVELYKKLTRSLFFSRNNPAGKKPYHYYQPSKADGNNVGEPVENKKKAYYHYQLPQADVKSLDELINNKRRNLIQILQRKEFSADFEGGRAGSMPYSAGQIIEICKIYYAMKRLELHNIINKYTENDAFLIDSLTTNYYKNAIAKIHLMQLKKKIQQKAEKSEWHVFSIFKPNAVEQLPRTIDIIINKIEDAEQSTNDQIWRKCKKEIKLLLSNSVKASSFFRHQSTQTFYERMYLKIH